ncbi:PAS domain-containing sensor histidine kinase [Roseivirga echinicomitans]|uniref:histidine kinase n=1 Tax=Roseivirga echinicomitans TaxID=296218 RepID=A0A150XUA1_9BACT|nr:PAS domain-containing sensor histidine kinase [Roseivirga echinicomitans]KYG82266.1 hypothetical protein AWN68_15605 [Roseivirga echinicomitans]
MIDEQIALLERALGREKLARKEAEKILEEKSLELYELNQKLKIANTTSTPKPTKKENGVYSSLADAYLKMDLAGNALEMNEAAIELFGYDLQNESLNIVNLIYRDDFTYAMNCYKDLIKNGAFTDYVARVYTKEGPYKLVHINANLVYNDKKVAIAAEGIIRDITEENKARVLIEEQRAELSTIVNSSPFGIVLTENGTIIKSNKAFQDMMGFTVNELQHIDPIEFILPQDVSKIQEIQAQMNSGEKNRIDFTQEIKTKKGELIKVRVNITTIFDDHGKPKYRLSILENITEEARRNALIEDQREQLEVIFDNSPLGIVLSDNGALTKVNQALLDLLGYTHEESKSLRFEDITHAGDLAASKGLMQKIQNGEQDTVILKKRYIKKDGTTISAKSNLSVVRDSTGKIKYHVIVIEDISEQERAEQQKENLLKRLEKSNNELQEYAHVVSHDLKSPLRSISALVSWIKEDCNDIMHDQGHRNLDLIELTVEKMESLINGILTYSAIERAKDEERVVSIDETIENIVALLYIPDHITVTVNKPLPSIYADPTRVQQLFQNLIGNAINYIDKEVGTVEIDYQDAGKYWIYSIKDNGVGIAKEYHEKIFGIFQSLNTDPKKGSTGIGLSIVKKIVEQYEGEIYLESEEGVGTTFFLKFKK